MTDTELTNFQSHSFRRQSLFPTVFTNPVGHGVTDHDLVAGLDDCFAGNFLSVDENIRSTRYFTRIFSILPDRPDGKGRVITGKRQGETNAVDDLARKLLAKDPPAPKKEDAVFFVTVYEKLSEGQKATVPKPQPWHKVIHNDFKERLFDKVPALRKIDVSKRIDQTGVCGRQIKDVTIRSFKELLKNPWLILLLFGQPILLGFRSNHVRTR